MVKHTGIFPLCLWGLAHAQRSLPVSNSSHVVLPVHAVVPTTTGQVGVNPITDDIGAASDYIAPIGSDTNILSLESSTTKWIGVNTEFLTQTTITATSNSETTTSVIDVHLTAETATAAAEGVAAGDVVVTLSNELTGSLGDVVDTIVKACAQHLTVRCSPLGGSCALSHASSLAQDDATLGLVNPADWSKIALDITADAPAVLADAWQVLKTQAERNKFSLIVGALAVTGGSVAANVAAEVAPKLKFESGKVGKPIVSTKVTMTQTSTTSTSSSTSSSACDPSATASADSPDCDADDCKGDDDRRCTTGENEGCVCVQEASYHSDTYDTAFGAAQVSLFAAASALNIGPTVTTSSKASSTINSATITPRCTRVSPGNDFKHVPFASPSAWCACVWGETGSGNFMTYRGDADHVCAYQSIATSRSVSVTIRPKAVEAVTSCRLASGFDTTRTTPFCTCNDDSKHTPTVSKDSNGAVRTSCAAPVTWTGTATAAPSCYPTHGTDPDADQLMSLCNPALSSLCTTLGGKGGKCQSTDVLDNQRPIANNHYDATFEMAEGAPLECANMFNNPTNEQSNSICVPILKQIVEACPWNGGEATNQCGTFKFQS